MARAPLPIEWSISLSALKNLIDLTLLDTGDLLIENFFKQLNRGNDVSSPIQDPVIDNILIKLVNITFCRAVMTLAGTLEVQVCFEDV